MFINIFFAYFFQAPIQGFLLLNSDLLILPLERSMNGIMFTFVVAELFFGFAALRRITKHQAKKFHLKQLRMGAQPPALFLTSKPDIYKD